MIEKRLVALCVLKCVPIFLDLNSMVLENIPHFGKFRSLCDRKMHYEISVEFSCLILY